ncbi:MAG: hypothetical protein GDA36_12475 [Rhodobacteraceae bacterium]|nr:hypothetical protein [Paracoccaceae bacterium]
MIFWPGVAVRSRITGRSGDHRRPRPGSHIDTSQDRAEEQAPDDPPDDSGVHFRADTQARWVRNRSKRTLGYKMKSNGFARPDEDEEDFIDKVHITAANRAGSPGVDTMMIEGANMQAGIGR